MRFLRFQIHQIQKHGRAVKFFDGFRRVFVALLALALSMGLQAHAGGGQCADLFSAASEPLAGEGLQAALGRAATGRLVSLDQLPLVTLSAVDPARQIYRIGADEVELQPSRGGVNSGILFFRSGASTRVLKRFELSERSFSAEGIGYFERLTRGNILASKAGGPALISTGLLEDSASKKLYFFVELEMLFPGEEFFILKNDQPRTDVETRWLRRKDAIDKIASQFVRTLELGIDPKDPDMAIAVSSGEVRWIDGDFFSTELTPASVSNAFNQIWALLPTEARKKFATAVHEKLPELQNSYIRQALEKKTKPFLLN